jgi:hypothetical protein
MRAANRMKLRDHSFGLPIGALTIEARLLIGAPEDFYFRKQ